MAKANKEKLLEDLERTKARRLEIDRKIQELEQKILDCTRQEIVGLVEEANLTPDQLKVVICYAKQGKFGMIPGKEEKKNEG